MSTSLLAKFVKTVPKLLEEYNKEIVLKIKEALSLTDEQVSTLVETIKVEDLKTTGRKSGGTKTRAPTAYNLFVQSKIKEIKAANPDMDRKILMVEAAKAWTLEKEKKAKTEVEAVAVAKEAKSAKKAKKVI